MSTRDLISAASVTRASLGVALVATLASCGPLSPTISKTGLGNITKNLNTRSTDASAFRSRCDLENQSAVNTVCAATALTSATQSRTTATLSANGAHSSKFGVFKTKGRVSLSARDLPEPAIETDMIATSVVGEGAAAASSAGSAATTSMDTVTPTGESLRVFLVLDLPAELEATFNADMVKTEAKRNDDGTCWIYLPALQPGSKANPAEVKMTRTALSHLKEVTIVSYE